jgi:hypothetical protein
VPVKSDSGIARRLPINMQARADQECDAQVMFWLDPLLCISWGLHAGALASADGQIAYHRIPLSSARIGRFGLGLSEFAPDMAQEDS